MPVDHGDAATLLKAVRELLTCPLEPRVEVPEEVAGWLEPQPGEPRDARGQRPVALVVHELSERWRQANMNRLDRRVAAAYYGLAAFPVDLAGEDASSVASRIAAEGSARPAASTLDLRRRRAVAAVAEVLDPRPAVPRTPDTCPTDPGDDRWWAEPWASPGAALIARSPHPRRSELLVRRAALDATEDDIAVGGHREARLRDALCVLRRDVDRALSGRWQPPPRAFRPSTVDRRRIRAAATVELWELLQSRARTADALTTPPPDALTTPPASVLISGPVPQPSQRTAPWHPVVPAPTDTSDHAGVERLEREIEAAWWALATGPQAPRKGEAHLARAHEAYVARAHELTSALPRETRVRLRSKAVALFAREGVGRGDWGAVVAARRLRTTVGASLVTFPSLIDGAIAATAHRRFDVAERLLADGHGLLGAWRAPAALPCPWEPARERQRAVERTEFAQQLALVAANVQRRRLLTLLAEAHPSREAVAREEVPVVLASARRFAARADQLLESLPDGWDGHGDPRERHGGDATGAWRILPRVIKGELEACAALWRRTQPFSGVHVRGDPLDRAAEHLAEARACAAAGPRDLAMLHQLGTGIAYLAGSHDASHPTEAGPPPAEAGSHPAEAGSPPAEADSRPAGAAAPGDAASTELATQLRRILDADLPTPAA
ncbi:hypothetical protein ER308_14915 [Egibacter rhizosphaerae]|uniref:Uncharacterized protein n=1 Tax=Egibacter rhizosphaerae TaxID=1670831 RepID=A0A411YHA8_9ACTN|nr:hypothetical protein [Egibacter rhizosphaerae]QBI20725.1 hypothetical protein ER308_14915 [Egibacter rhizosphaerae]